MRLITVVLLMAAAPASAITCGAQLTPQPLPARGALVAPVAAEVAGAPALVRASGSLLASPRDERLALDVILLRLRDEACLAEGASAAGSDSYAGYQKKTEHDNTPWRYEPKPGEQFSAAEFDAWMKSRGVRVAKGRAQAPVTEAATE